MFKKDLLGVEAENNKISAKFLVSVESNDSSFGYRKNSLGSIKPTSWEGHYIDYLYTYYDGSDSAFVLTGDTTGITKSISITRLDTNKTLSGTGSYFPFAGRTIYNLNGVFFTSSDVNRRIEIEVWYEI